MIDEKLLSDGNRNAIRIWVRMIQAMPEERAVKFLTGIVTNLAGDDVVLQTVIKATENQQPS